MSIVYFDSGTSKSRAYLIEGKNIADSMICSIGSKDTSLTGSNSILIKALKSLYDELVSRHNIADKCISDIYASGMVTSPYGIYEVPHISLPVSLQDLADNVYLHFEPAYFKRVMKLIRGVKSVPDDYTFNPKTVSDVNNMRGEEIEVFGILPKISDLWGSSNAAIFLPGSHTHAVYTEKGVIVDVWSTFSGEIYHALSTSTILSDSAQTQSAAVDADMVLLGFNNTEKYGFNRALYICHAMKIFGAADNARRKSYLEGVIVGEIVSAFMNNIHPKWKSVNRFVIAGDLSITRPYEILIKHILPQSETVCISADDSGSFAVMGFIKLIEQMSVYQSR